MKVFKYLLPLAALLAVFSAGSAQAEVRPKSPDSYANELIDRDFDALRDFINSKRTINVEEKDCNLYISGDVRTDWLNTTEKQSGCRIRGGNFADADGVFIGRNEFEIEFNLRFDYVCDRAWAVARVQFDCDAGVSDYAKECCSKDCHFDKCCGDEIPCCGGSSSSESCSGDSHQSGSHQSGSHHSGSRHLKGHKKSSEEMKAARKSASSSSSSSSSCSGSSEDQWTSSSSGSSSSSSSFDSGSSSASSSLSNDNRCFCQECDSEGFHGSGNSGGLSLKDAYVGYNICCDGATRFDIELGRHANLYRVFDSEIQFLSRFDGVLLKYSSNWECVADWYLAWAGFVVDYVSDHFAWVTELGALNICDYGVDFKYSFIDWVKQGHNRCGINKPEGFQFRISQFTLAYNFDVMCMPSRLFGAYLWNHSGKKHGDCGRQNKGWYVGFEVGKVRHEGDWAFSAQYEVVEAYAIPDGDVSGIGRGNAFNNSMTANFCGNTNYKGWRLDGVYAITDNLTINPRFDWSTEEDANIGGSHRYTQFKLEAVYAF